MNERLMQFRVGVMVLATLIITAILVALFGGMPSMLHGKYTIYVQFSDAPGVARDTPVRKSGIRIGRVTKVRLTDDERPVLVTAEIDTEYQLHHNEVCRAVSSILMGDAALEFSRSPDPNAPTTLIEPGETLQGVTSQDPSRAIANLQQNLTNTIGSVDETAKGMQSVFTRLDRLLSANEDRISRVIVQADKTLDVMQQTLTSANGILGDPQVRAQFKDTMAQLPKVLTKVQVTMDEMGEGLNALQANLRNLEGVTKPLGERGETLVRRIDASTDKLDRLMDEMLRFTESLNSSQGSLGQLLHDRELYQHINRAAKNIEELSRELGPLMDDVRVFSDKIARHPEVLGVRGAIQKNSGMK